MVPTGGSVLMILREANRQKRTLLIGLLTVNILLAILTSFGIPEIRYTAVIWPLAALHAAALPYWLVERREDISRGILWIK